MLPGLLIVEIIPESGVLSGAPLRLNARSVVVRLPNGTPVAVASAYGPDGAYLVSNVNDPHFERALRQVGVNETVEVDVYEARMPEGGRIIESV